MGNKLLHVLFPYKVSNITQDFKKTALILKPQSVPVDAVKTFRRSEVKKDMIYDRLLIESSVGFHGKILKVLVMVGPFTFAGSGPDGTHTQSRMVISFFT